jgi:hypothetical protein
LRKVALEEYGVEEKWFRTVKNFNIWTPITTAKKLSAVTWMREKTFLPLAAEETDNFFGEIARLLNRVEK